MSKSGTVIQLLQARLERAIRRRRENPSRADILMIPALALALDACGGGGSQRPTPPPPPPPPPPAAATITVDSSASVDEEADGGEVTSFTVENETSVTADDDRFDVTGGNGNYTLKLKSGQTLDFETDTSPISVVITASSDGDPATATVSVSISDVNEAPSANADDFTVKENEAGVALGAITISDPDANDTHTVTVSGPAGFEDHFEARQDAEGNWWVALKEGMSLDHEAGATVEVTVTVTDADGLTSEPAKATITVSNVNEAPSAPVVRNADALNVDENDDDASVGVLELSTDPEGDAITYHVNDGRFEIDASGALKLKDGMSLNHETAASVSLVITAMDASGNTSGATMVTVWVNDLNEGADVAVQPGNETRVAGETFEETVDLGAMFNDPDEGDQPVRYEVEGPSAWGLKLTVVYGSKDGKETITGTISSGKPIPAGTLADGSDDYPAETITIVAIDGDGLRGEATFKVYVDDGNDAPTGLTLTTDGAVNTYRQVEVDENDASGVVLGTLTVADIDSPNHPHGQYDVKVNNAKFDAVAVSDNREDGWYLVLKEGMSLDHEVGATVDIVVTATDVNGDLKEGKSISRTVTVTVNDLNDAPTTDLTKVGNWWVTVDEDLDADDVTAGQWLKFGLDDDAFEDEDTGVNGKLTYTVDGPAWLEINKITGVMQNSKEMLPERGVYDVTVTATDTLGESVSLPTFKLAVALSDENDEDNDEPSIDVTTENDYIENSGAEMVAEFTVTDEDMDISPHPYGDVKKPTFTATGEGSDGKTVSYASNFTLKPAGETGNTQTWQLWTTVANKLDHETVDDIEFTLTVADAKGAMDTEDFRIDIDDGQEAPEYEGPGASSTKNLSPTVEQSGKKTTLYLNLPELWEDPDRKDSDDELTFTVVSPTAWITVTTAPSKWEDVRDGKDGKVGGTDDVKWGAGLTPPGDDDMVAIVVIDRTLANNDQAAVTTGGAITLTATDEQGNVSTDQTLKVTVTDENLPIADGAVTLSGVASEGNTLTATFDETKDPDLAGDASARLVVYTWNEVTRGEKPTDKYVVGKVLQESVSTDSTDSLTLTQDHVGMEIQVSVAYYEDFDEKIVSRADAGKATTLAKVVNVQDEGTATFEFLTSATGLEVEVEITDPDGVPDGQDSDLAFTWQSSANGIGGWADATDSDKSDMALTLALADGKGLYYRVVVTYTDDDDVAERIVSDKIQVGKLDHPSDKPAVSGSHAVGGVLTVVAAAGDTVQWQRENKGEPWEDIGTGQSFTVTSQYAGATLRALVTSEDAAGNVTAVAKTQNLDIASVANTAPVVLMDHKIDVADPADAKDIAETIPLADMFQDANGDDLTYTIKSPSKPSNWKGNSLNSSDKALFQSNDGSPVEQLAYIDSATGEFIYKTNLTGGHDGKEQDGGGNVLTFDVEATDGRGGKADANIELRVNVAPTGIVETGNVGLSETTKGAATTGTVVAKLNVQDQNATDHAYGTHTVKVTDDRFAVVDDKDGDGSTWNLVLKAGKSVDYEGKDIIAGVLTVTLTIEDDGGQKTAVPAKIMIKITNDPSDDPTPVTPVTPDLVPGLKDDDADKDDDGGLAPPPAVGMSQGGLSGLIGDLTNLQVEDDLLDSFVLAIDDGLELG